MFVYVFTAAAFLKLGAPWWAFVLFIVCDLIDDQIYDAKGGSDV
jgi:hypothetical protein